MVITALVLMCHVLGPTDSLTPATPSNLDTGNAPKCEPVVVTDSDRTPGLTMLGCMLSQPAIAQWKTAHPLYKSDEWRIADVKCIATDQPLDIGRAI